MNKKEKTALTDIHYVRLVPVGSVNPNNPLSDQSIGLPELRCKAFIKVGAYRSGGIYLMQNKKSLCK